MAAKAHKPRQYKTVMNAGKRGARGRGGGRGKSYGETSSNEALATKVGSYLDRMTKKSPGKAVLQAEREHELQELQIKADINNKMDDRFSVMLTNPNCPEDLASDLTLHFKEQLKKRREAL